MNRTHQKIEKWYDCLPTCAYQYYLIFDTETTIDERQALRFGTYELHGKEREEIEYALRLDNVSPTFCDELIQRGIFYNSLELSIDEIYALRDYAKKRGIPCLTLQEFVRYFYYYAHHEQQQCLVIGHNLSFDLTRLAQEWQYAKGDFENGFSLKLCDCTWERSPNAKTKKRYIGDSCQYHSNIRFKKISPKTHLYDFTGRKPRGCFLDTQTFARAILGPGATSLEALGEILDIDDKKLTDHIEHGTLSEQYIDYAMRDTRATWQIFQKLRDIYATYGFSQKMHLIFSEASLGKALYKELGISPPIQRMKSISPEIHGYAMSTYYGGRCEVHMRKKPVEVAYCDFKSEYPSAFSLMGLQDMLLAGSYSIHAAKHEVENLLDFFSLDKLQKPDYWKRLKILCKISGDNLILPIRAKYHGNASNIALCKTSIKSTWYTLSDILANIILGGDRPIIERAIEVVPNGKIHTNRVEMFDGLVSLNPQDEDIFVKLINERTRIKKLAKQTKNAQYIRTQLALKILANATSYGINIELRDVPTDEHVTLYGNDGAVPSATPIAQIPGAYYCAEIGTHIPAGGRLLLAIAQRLGMDRGLNYAFCDTDSIAYVKPPYMSRQEFISCVQDIQDWFLDLYPYNDGGDLLELEDVNKLNGIYEPLYCLAVSSKRYVLYNILRKQEYKLRKLSAHGLGAIQASAQNNQDKYKAMLAELGLAPYQKWIYDLWYEFVYWMHNDTSFGRFFALKGLDTPVFHQLTLSTAHLYKQFSVPGMRPCNFVTVFPQLPTKLLKERIALEPDKRVYYERITSAMYVPFTRNVHDVRTMYVIGSNMRIEGIKPMTVAESLESYFDHGEHKAANGFLHGEMQMREVEVDGYIMQGKESSYEIAELDEQDLPENLSPASINYEYITVEKWHWIQDQCYKKGISEIARLLKEDKVKMWRIINQEVPPGPIMLKNILNALAFLDHGM